MPENKHSKLEESFMENITEPVVDALDNFWKAMDNFWDSLNNIHDR